MKNRVGRILASLLVGLLALASSAHAQWLGRVIKVNIPFAFTVGSRAFPPGTYRLVEVAPAILQLRDADDRCLWVAVTNSVEASTAPQSPKVYFYSQGGQYALSEVWQENDSIGRQLALPKSWGKVARRDARHTQIIAADTSR